MVIIKNYSVKYYLPNFRKDWYKFLQNFPRDIFRSFRTHNPTCA